MPNGDDDLAHYEELVRLERQGRVVFGIDRILARSFYTDIQPSVIEEQTGETQAVQKYLIQLAFGASHVGILATCIVAIIEFRWWAILIVPLCVSFWMAYYSQSSKGGSSTVIVTPALILSAILLVVNPFSNQRLALLLFLFSFSLWSIRFVYDASTRFFRSFVLRNYRAFLWLKGQLVIRRVQVD